jgi:hypothetical protein
MPVASRKADEKEIRGDQVRRGVIRKVFPRMGPAARVRNVAARNMLNGSQVLDFSRDSLAAFCVGAAVCIKFRNETVASTVRSTVNIA